MKEDPIKKAERLQREMDHARRGLSLKIPDWLRNNFLWELSAIKGEIEAERRHQDGRQITTD